MTHRVCIVRAPALAMMFVAMISAATARADGGPPLLTDDPGTPGDGHWEINLAWTSQRSGDARYDEAPLADINYGVGHRLQLKFEMPWIIESGRGNDGFGAALAGVKWRFLDRGENGWQGSTYPQVEFLPPVLHRNGSAESGTRYLLPIEAERNLGPVDMDFEIGRTLAPSSAEDGWIAGVAFGRKISERVTLLGELHDETRGGFGAHELVVNVGGRATMSAHINLLASVGSDVDNSIGPRNRWMSYLGLQIEL